MSFSIGGPSSASTLSVYSKIRSAAQLAAVNNPHKLDPTTNLPQLATGSSLPAITYPQYANLAAAQAAYPNYYSYSANPGLYRMTGGVPTLNSSGWIAAAAQLWTTGVANVSNNPPVAGQFWRTSFVADANAVLVYVGNYGRFRFMVNGQYTSLSYVVPTSNSGWILLDFTAAGGRQVRTITVETSAWSSFSGYFWGALVGNTEAIYPVGGSTPLKMFVMGDSWSNGWGANHGDAYTVVMADMLGIGNVVIDGIASTSWGLQGTGPLFAGQERMFNLANYATNADLMFFQFGVNDINQHNSTAFAQAQGPLLSCLQQARAYYPTMPIFIPGVTLPTGLTYSSNKGQWCAAFETSMAAYLTSLNDPNLFFLPVATATPPLLTGAGFTGATTGTGNADFYWPAGDPTTLAIAAGGTGYVVNEQLWFAGSDPRDEWTLIFPTAVTGGVVSAATVHSSGWFSNPISGNISQVATNGAGTGLSLTPSVWTTLNVNNALHTGGVGNYFIGQAMAASLLAAIAGKP